MPALVAVGCVAFGMAVIGGQFAENGTGRGEVERGKEAGHDVL